MTPILFAMALIAAEPQEPAAAATTVTPATVAAPAKPETAAERRRRLRAEADAKIECRTEKIGSSLGKPVCLPVATWRRIREETVRDFQDQQDVASPGFSGNNRR